MTTYRVTKPLHAFEPKEKRAVTIPPGSLIEKEYLEYTVDLTSVRWCDRVVWVPIPDLLERSEPVGEIGEDGAFHSGPLPRRFQASNTAASPKDQHT
jgi:hypothetical protein